MVPTSRLALLALLLTASSLKAQSEDDLRRYFEGRRITVKIAMPGTEEGVDIYPGTDQPLDYPRYARRLKEHGTAIRSGSDAMITRIRVKSKHIEFHLDGGGYGTMSDETSSSVHVESTPKSNREKSLEAEYKREKDTVRRRQLKEELDDLRNAREREDSRNRAEVADAEEQKKENIRERRLQGGSRFNVRYRDVMPAEVLSAKGLEAALAQYVDFPVPPTAAAPAEPTPASGGLPRKGMTPDEVESLLGAPTDTSERSEGTLRVVTRSYRSAGGKVKAEFVENVLIRYSMTSE